MEFLNGEFIGKGLGRFPVADADEGVVQLRILDPLAAHPVG